jgi:spoIIIJ-associated protein
MTEELGKQAVEFTTNLLELAGFSLEAATEETEEGLRVVITGDDVPLLLGHNAELLNAFEYLCNRVLVSGDAGNKIIFDSNGYRALREKELRMMAQKAAEKVKSSGVPFSFDPMSPSERRIVHLALVDDKMVHTESHGGGHDRKVTIYRVK